jgi:2,3-dihydroxybiphenyl 1,2-dioxygenase
MASSECARRYITEGISFRDPAGNRVECFYGAVLASDPFVPGREVPGFRTGSQGLGHAVLTTTGPDALIAFYQELLGFRLSDYQLKPFKAYFFHLNERHHSLAINESPHMGLHHIMVEMLNLDDVGQAYDIALTHSDMIGVTLGRHSNDNMLSFYAKTPSGFLVECGWGGRTVDVDNWVPEELTIGPSLWGHELGWLPPEKRAEAARMRMRAAQDGYRVPVHVYGDNYDIGPVCGLWQHLKRS